MVPKIGIVGLGYVGLPLALAFARAYPEVAGFDRNAQKVKAIQAGSDPTDEGFEAQIKNSPLKVGSSADVLKGCNFFVVAVPTPVDINHNPDLEPLISACNLIGPLLKGGEIIVFESTVYPGITEDICGPALAKASGLRQGVDFKLGYSPERVNPGDKEHTLEKILKIVSGEDAQTLEAVAAVYGKVIQAGLHLAPSIKVAEAAMVIENTQRDLNIALMNELALIFDRMEVSTRDVLAAAGTKWNFMKFSPGLVGGHCIGVDPYYLTCKAEQLGYHPQVILAGRRINDGMGAYIAQKLVKLLINSGIQPKGARVGILGLTFKENVTDLRNSRVPDIINELKQFGVECIVHDAMAHSHHAQEEYGITLSPWDKLKNLDGMVVAVSHRQYMQMAIDELLAGVKKGGVVVDVKGCLKRESVPEGLGYWSL